MAAGACLCRHTLAAPPTNAIVNRSRMSTRRANCSRRRCRRSTIEDPSLRVECPRYAAMATSNSACDEVRKERRGTEGTGDR
jgi:hypothetical protein